MEFVENHEKYNRLITQFLLNKRYFEEICYYKEVALHYIVTCKSNIANLWIDAGEIKNKVFWILEHFKPYC